MNVNDTKDDAQLPDRTDGFVAASDAMKRIFRQVQQVAGTGATVLLTGESGVGKEVVAKALFQLGSRRNRALIKVNCGAIPAALLESEMFGYERGAFTGADPRGKLGYFRLAHTGTLFLDEIGELPLALQVKLLRVLQDSEVTPVGGTEPKKIDVQIVAATNTTLEKMVADGLFRQDLYYRLNVVPIHIPALRERPEDIQPLARHFLEQHNRKYSKTVTFTDGAFQALQACPWYGNVRELEHIVERVVVTQEHDVMTPDRLRAFLPQYRETSEVPIVPKLIPLAQAVEAVEEKLILMALEKHKTARLAAACLEISTPTFSRKHRAVQARIEARTRTASTDKDRSAWRVEEELDKQLRTVAIVAAASLNLDYIRDLSALPRVENQTFERLRRQLTAIREREGTIAWTYIWFVTPDYQVVNLVSDSNLPLDPGEVYLGPPEMMRAVHQAMAGTVTVTPRYTDRFGCFKSCLAPIKDETGQVIAVFGSDYSANYIERQLAEMHSSH